MTLAVDRLTSGDLDPAFTDAILIDIEAFLVVEADANIVLEYGRDMKGTALVRGESIG